MATGLKMLLAVLLLSASQIAAAESLPDPTRPAIDLGSVAGAAGSTMDAVPADTASHGLQSVIISPQRRAAIINGEVVKLGEKYGNSRLVEVRESSVVLENAHGRQVMEMFPRVDIRKNEAGQQSGNKQEKASGQTSAPAQAVGGIK